MAGMFRQRDVQIPEYMLMEFMRDWETIIDLIARNPLDPRIQQFNDIFEGLVADHDEDEDEEEEEEEEEDEKKVVVVDIHEMSDNVTDDQLKCVVCHENMVHVEVYVCVSHNHFLCQKCVDQMQHISDPNKCPVCRLDGGFKPVLNWHQKITHLVKPCEIGCGMFVHPDDQEQHYQDCVNV